MTFEEYSSGVILLYSQHEKESYHGYYVETKERFYDSVLETILENITHWKRIKFPEAK